MTLTPDEVKNAGPLGNAWVALRAAEGDIGKLVPCCADEMHLIACLWRHLEDVDAWIEEAIHRAQGGDAGDGGGEDADARADTSQAQAWLFVPCRVSDEEDPGDAFAGDEEEDTEPSSFSEDDEEI